jgi:mycofactocin system FadH/OYE family oxidoreductase 2
VFDAAGFEAAVLTAGSTEAVLDRLPPGPVLVHDPVGDAVGVGVAEQVAAAGRDAVLVTPDQVAGVQLARTGDLVPANSRLARAGVVRELRSRIVAVRDGCAVLEHVWTGERREVACAAVIDCGPRLPADDLWRARPHLPRAGDCIAPRTVHEAVLEGRRAALALVAAGTPTRAPESSNSRTRIQRLARLPASRSKRVRESLETGARVAPTLSSPLRVGPLTLPNRLVFCAHLTDAALDGLPTEQHAAYYAARAAGGAGMIITEEHSVHPGDRPYEKLVRGFDPAAIPGHRRLTDAVHAHGVPVLAQLNHNGGQSSGMYSREPVWGPSPVPDPLFREVPKEITVAQIREVVEGYALAAEHCVAGGFDGVEIQCSQASLLRQFLSPLTNHRSDRYGGELADRVRIVREVVAAVRGAIGPDRALGVRLCGDEGIRGGTSLPEAVATAKLLDADGQVDYLSTSVGVATATLHLVEPPMPVPSGYALPVAAAIRAAVSVPVIGVGRFTNPADADRALADGHCDLVGVVRGQIADPGFAGPSGLPRGRRTCVACNQECAGRVGLNQRLGCLVNPRAGRESVPLPPPGPRRRVLVVGGGPAGLSAAATAAARGHRVTLYERERRTGGQIEVAAAAPGRTALAAVVRDLLAECAEVEIHTGVAVDAAVVERERPDAVVLATGARPARPDWAIGLACIADVRDVLTGAATPSGSVLVYDELGFHQATSTAELLAARGCTVEIATPAMIVGQDLGLTLDMELFHRRAQAAGIRMITDRAVLAAAADGPGVVLTVLDHLVGAVSEIRYDWVVTAVPPEPEDALWQELRESGLPVHRIGDCLAPRRADAAIREGHLVGVTL